MAVLTFEELLAGRTTDQIRARLFARLNKKDFPITDEASGAVVRTVVEAAAAAISDDVASMVPRIAGGGFVEEAEPDWLALLAHENYAVDKVGASWTIQLVKLRAANGVGPYTVAAGDLVVQAASGNRYILNEGGTIPLGTNTSPGNEGVDFKSLLFKAESPGSQYADAAGAITTLVTPLPGVTAINSAPTFSVVGHAGTGTGSLSLGGTPAGPARYQVRITANGQADAATFEYSLDGASYLPGGVCASAGVVMPESTVIAFVNGVSNPSFVTGDTYSFGSPGSPIVVQGADEETSEALGARMMARWPSLAEVPTSDIYEQWARAASTEVTKVTVTPNNSAAAPGRVDIVIAGAVNPLSGAVGTVQAYIDERAGITEHPVVAAATVVDIEGAGSVYVNARDLTRIQTAAQLAWQVYVAGLPIGGTVRAAKLVQILMDLGAIDYFDLFIGPTGDVIYPDFTVASTEVMQAVAGTDLATLLTWIVV
jgi:uncharacterized phage protein gp47/JayE